MKVILYILLSWTPFGWKSFDSRESQEELQFKPGMRSVPGWLKYHRLHKYTSLFVCMSYQDLLDLTEEKLLSLGATKGAARKISKCVEKLHERHDTLQDICDSLDKGTGDIRKHLSDLEDVLKSPVLLEEDAGKDCGGQNLISLIVMSLTKLCSSLLLSPTSDSKTGEVQT